ncbi:MAG TPA: hypothetical protein VFI20_00945 [Terracidiphilus sp.]|nr:hypothetical protein [Terracidiphilus sp.]
MAKVTLVFAVLMIALGLAGYLGTGSQHPTALIPAWFGLALGVFGLLANSRNERKRKLFMHVNVVIGLLGFLGAGIEAIRGYVHAGAVGAAVDMPALESKLVMAVLMLVYVLLCVRSFISARRKRTV